MPDLPSQPGTAASGDATELQDHHHFTLTLQKGALHCKSSTSFGSTSRTPKERSEQSFSHLNLYQQTETQLLATKAPKSKAASPPKPSAKTIFPRDPTPKQSASFSQLAHPKPPRDHYLLHCPALLAAKGLINPFPASRWRLGWPLAASQLGFFFPVRLKRSLPATNTVWGPVYRRRSPGCSPYLENH